MIEETHSGENSMTDMSESAEFRENTEICANEESQKNMENDDIEGFSGISEDKEIAENEDNKGIMENAEISGIAAYLYYYDKTEKLLYAKSGDSPERYVLMKKEMMKKEKSDSEDESLSILGSCGDCGGNILREAIFSLPENLENFETSVEKTDENNSSGNHFIVSSCSGCGKFCLHVYDENWKWIDDSSVFVSNGNASEIRVYERIVRNAQDFDKIPENVLMTVFSKTEAAAIREKLSGKSPERQYLYRAKSKLKQFEEIFGIHIDFPETGEQTN